VKGEVRKVKRKGEEEGRGEKNPYGC